MPNPTLRENLFPNPPPHFLSPGWESQAQNHRQSLSLRAARDRRHSLGAVLVLQEIARNVGIVKALGRDPQARLVLWLIVARILDPGSRLSAVRLAGQHAACDLIGMDAFNEDDLYAALDWLANRQAAIGCPSDGRQRASDPRPVQGTGASRKRVPNHEDGVFGDAADLSAQRKANAGARFRGHARL